MDPTDKSTFVQNNFLGSLCILTSMQASSINSMF